MTAARNRITGFDVARAVALMAMVLVNFASMLEVGTQVSHWIITAVNFLYGRAATVFVILAGASLSMTAARYQTSSRLEHLKAYMLKRSALLFIAGILLSFWWDADILHFYAIFIAIGAFWVAWSDEKLGRMTLLFILISVPVCATLTAAYDSADELAFMEGRIWFSRLLLDYFSNRFYSLFPWMAFFLIGMVFGRRAGTRPGFYLRCAIIGALIFIAVEVLSAFLVDWTLSRDVELYGNWGLTFIRSESFPTTPLFMVSSVSGALAFISICRIVAAHHALTGLLAPVASFGRFSLTIYIAHIVVGFWVTRWIESSQGLATPVQLLWSAGLFCLAGVVWAVFWTRWLPRGPLEMVFYRLTRGHTANSLALRPCPVEAERVNVRKV